LENISNEKKELNMSNGKFTATSATNTSSDAVITVPTGQKWKIKAIEVDLNTSATVGNRRVAIEVVVNGLLVQYAFSSYQQPASAHNFYAFGPGLTTDSSPIDVDLRTGFPEVYLGPGDTIGTGLLGIQTGDVVNIAVNYEAFLT
jgi:hypothetical protein